MTGRSPREPSERRYQRLQHRLIRADAGTGKTYTLTVQFLRLLAAGVDPKRVLATTFTRKAAGEILERILLRVANAALSEDAAGQLSVDLGVDTANDAAKLVSGDYRRWLCELVDLLPQLSVGTLDAFFRRLVSGFRYELGLVRMQRIASLDDPLVSALRERAVRTTLERLSGGAEPLSALTMRLYRGQAQRSVAWAVDRVFLELYQVYRESPERVVWSQLEVPKGLLGQERLLGAVSAWDELWKPDVVANRKAAEARLGKKLIGGLETSAVLLDEHDWSSFLAKGVGLKVDQALLSGEDGCSYSKKALSPELFSAYASLVRHARAALFTDLRDQTLATHRLLEVFHEEFGQLRKREGVVLFSDLADIIARDLPSLGLDLELALGYRLDGQVEHVLLDEFQDTSVVQWSALRLLVDEVLAWGDGSKTLFCVGDAKQSIYGWRGGRPELFGIVEQHLAAMEDGAASIEPLAQSYRSSPVVLEAVNRVFSSIGNNPGLSGSTEDHATRVEAAIEWAEDFTAHSAAEPRRADPGYVVLRTSRTWEGMFDDEGNQDESADGEGGLAEEQPLGHLGFAAEKIREVCERRPDATIGVLTRSNRVVGEALFALRAQGVEASGEGHGSVVDDPATTAVISALRLSASPADTASLVHLARTPLGSVLGVATELGQVPVEAERLRAEAVRVSREIREGLFADGACALLARWCRALSRDVSTRSRARLQQLMEVMIDQQHQLDRSPGELVRFLARVSVEEPAPAQVRVMTIHQAKGLEFDVVVLCELETQLGALYGPLVEILRESPVSAPTAIVRASNAQTRRSDPLLQKAHAQEIARRMRDDLSAVYVALTRARSELHLLVQPTSAPPGKNRPTENFAVAGFLRGALCDEPEFARREEADRVLFESGVPLVGAASAIVSERTSRAGLGPENQAEGGDGRSVDADAEQPHASGEPDIDHAVRRLQRDRRSSRPRTIAPSRSGSTFLAEQQLRSLFDQESRGVIRGRLLHAYLAEVEWLTRPDVRESLWTRVCLQVAPGMDQTWLDSIRRDLRRMLNETEIAKVLERPRGASSRCWREHSFALAEHNEVGETHLVRGVFDRVVLLESAEHQVIAARVIDWKTGVGVGRDEAYRTQLSLYRRAAADLAGLMETAVRTSIVWLDRGLVEDI